MRRAASTHLGELEQRIMEALWARRAATVRDVFVVLKSKRRIAYTTVMTVMNRLVEKGLLRRKYQGACFCYQPIESKDVFFVNASRRAIDDLIKSFGRVAVNAFIDRLGETDPAIVRRLRQRFASRP